MCQYTGKPLHLDLIKGELVDEGGDVIIEPQMPATDAERRKAANPRGIFPATFTIRVADGGLLESGSDLDGYDSASGVAVSDFPKKDLSGSIVRFRGFLRLRNGQLHGKLEMAVGAEDVGRGGQGRVVIRIENSLLNATGSRSLEIDPERLSKLTLTDGRSVVQEKP